MSTNTSKQFLIRLVSLCVSASKRAGSLIKDVAKCGDLGVGVDQNFDPQTEADRSSQLCIIGKLNQCFPSLKIIGEEEGLVGCPLQSVLDSIVFDKEVLTHTCPEEYVNLTEKDVILWVDPLDGTSAYFRGILEQTTVSIGIATVDGRPIAGIVHQPFYIPERINSGIKDYSSSTSRSIWGIIGLGVFGLGCRSSLKIGKSVALASLSHFRKSDQKLLDLLGVEKIINASGAVYKGLCVLERECDILIYSKGGTKKWDICAIDALFKAVGGCLTDIHGLDYNYGPNAPFDNSNGVFGCRDNSGFYLSKIRPISI